MRARKIVILAALMLAACGGTPPSPGPLPAPAVDMSTAPDLVKTCPGVDLLGDPKNCGSCGNVCPSGAASACQRGVCV